MQRVLKITTTDGLTFYSDDWSPGLVATLERQAAKRHGGVDRMELVEMTRAEYRSIPASNESATLFR